MADMNDSKLRIVVDMQGAQNGSRYRGIGRYTFAFTDALVRLCGEKHDVFLAFNSDFGSEIPSLIEHFQDKVSVKNMLIWGPTGIAHYHPHENDEHRLASEGLREAALAGLNPDIVIVSSMAEGAGDQTITSVGRFIEDIPTAAIFYDLIPLIYQSTYLQDGRLLEWFMEKVDHFRRCDLLFAISESSRREAVKYVGNDPEDVIPILAAISDTFSRTAGTSISDIKKKFNINRPYVMYSGATDPRKNLHRLIDAFAALDLSVLKKHQLVLAGGMPREHKDDLVAHVSQHPQLQGRVVFTDRVSDDEMVGLYRNAKAFVFPSYHEGFGLPALEAMAFDIPVIGADAASIPEIIALKEALFDPFSVSEMSQSIHRILTDDAFRERLVASSKSQFERFSWDQTAQRALAAIEAKAARGALSRSAFSHLPRTQQRLLLVEFLRSVAPSRIDHDNEAMNMAQQVMRALPRRPAIYVDISELYVRDGLTGIQRVTRNILEALMKSDIDDFDVLPVYTKDNLDYYVANDIIARIKNFSNAALRNHRIDPMPGDIFLGLDFHDVIMPLRRETFRRMRSLGVPAYFVIHDLLPQQFPQFFSPAVVENNAQWLRTVAEMDGIIAVTQTVADEFVNYIMRQNEFVSDNFKVGWFHNSGDLKSKVSRCYEPDGANALLLNTLSAGKTFLSVGTIEPRKGQKQLLDAFDILWKKENDVFLVLVGKRGWMVDELIKRFDAHPERNKRFFWFDQADDDLLAALYRAAFYLVVPSHGEGFGLPLAEAEQFALPILARDIPVFREIAPVGTNFFSGTEPGSLAVAIGDLLDQPQHLHRRSEKRRSKLPKNWGESAEQLLDNILGGKWYRELRTPRKYSVRPSDKRLGTHIGRREDGRLIANGNAGTLVFGPWLEFLPGKYEVTFLIKVMNVAKGSGTFKIYAEGGQHDITYKKIDGINERLGGKRSITLSFQISRRIRDVEFNVMLDEGIVVEIESIDISRV